MSDVLLSVENLAKRFGGIVATDNLSLSVTQGELHSVIGPNGAGKTTLISQLSGMLMPDQGVVRFDGVDITRTSAPQRSQMGLARSFQITSILKDFTVLENVSIAVQAHSGHSFNSGEQRIKKRLSSNRRSRCSRKLDCSTAQT